MYLVFIIFFPCQYILYTMNSHSNTISVVTLKGLGCIRDTLLHYKGLLDDQKLYDMLLVPLRPQGCGPLYRVYPFLLLLVTERVMESFSEDECEPEPSAQSSPKKAPPPVGISDASMSKKGTKQASLRSFFNK